MAKKKLVFDKETLTTLSKELNDLLKGFASKHGLILSAGFNSVRFDANSFRSKVEFQHPVIKPKVNIEGSLESFVGRQFKLKSRLITILDVNGDKLIGITQNGVKYDIRVEQLKAMEEITKKVS